MGDKLGFSGWIPLSVDSTFASRSAVELLAQLFKIATSPPRGGYVKALSLGELREAVRGNIPLNPNLNAKLGFSGSRGEHAVSLLESFCVAFFKKRPLIQRA